MIPQLGPSQLARYRRILALFLNYGRRDFFDAAWLEEMEVRESLSEETEAQHDADGLAAEVEALGPTLIMLGQMLASRPDILPRHYKEELSRLHYRVEPFEFEKVEEIVSDELGVRV